MTHPRTISAICAAALAISAFAAAEAAATSRITFIPGGAVTVAGNVTLSTPILSTSCTMSLTTSLPSTPTAVALSGLTRLGTVSSARLASCSAGTVSVLGLGWSVGLDPLLDPLVAKLAVLSVQIEFNALGILCLYTGTLALSKDFASGRALTMHVQSLPLTSGNAGLCGSLTVRGSPTLSVAQAVALAR